MEILTTSPDLYHSARRVWILCLERTQADACIPTCGVLPVAAVAALRCERFVGCIFVKGMLAVIAAIVVVVLLAKAEEGELRVALVAVTV